MLVPPRSAPPGSDDKERPVALASRGTVTRAASLTPAAEAEEEVADMMMGELVPIEAPMTIAGPMMMMMMNQMMMMT
jgi:Mrp family chromosome partitioning ATPase